MLFVDTPHITDPCLNLAIEEYLLRHVVVNEPISFFYVNEPSVVMGRNQNAFEEIDFDFVRENNVPFVRRLSGGGTVYHDFGNLNYSLITPQQDLLNNFTAFTLPVIESLAELGLKAELQNRSSLFVNDKKISGNAQYATAGKLMSHGTLLVDSDLEQLKMAISPRRQEVESRAIQSVRSHVANMNGLVRTPISIDSLKEILLRNFLGAGTLILYPLGESDWETIEEISQDRYRSWAWNIGRSPKFTLTRRVMLSSDELVLHITVDKGLIQEMKQEKHLPGSEAFTALFECLQGVRFDREALAAALQECDANSISLGLERSQIIDLLF